MNGINSEEIVGGRVSWEASGRRMMIASMEVGVTLVVFDNLSRVIRGCGREVWYWSKENIK